MKSSEIVQRLRVMGEDVETQYPDINAGGCAVYAATVALRLNALRIEAYGIVADYMKDLDISKSRSNLINATPHPVLNWNNAGVTFAHVLVKCRIGRSWWTHDTRGTTLSSQTHYALGGCYPIIKGHLDLQELSEIAADHGVGIWNSSFNRHCIPQIRKLIDSHLSTIE